MPESQPKKKTKEHLEAEAKIKELEAENAKLEDQKVDLAKQLDKEHIAISDLKSKLAEATKDGLIEDLSKARKEAEELRSKLRELTVDLNAANKEATRMRAAAEKAGAPIKNGDLVVCEGENLSDDGVKYEPGQKYTGKNAKDLLARGVIKRA